MPARGRKRGILVESGVLEKMFTPEGQKSIARGAATGPFTIWPDLLGMMSKIPVQPYTGDPSRTADISQLLGSQYRPPISGDPIRRAVGLDPKDPLGILGEMFDPINVAAKTLKSLPEIIGAAEAIKAAALLHGSPQGRLAKVPKGAKTDNIQDLFDKRFIGDPAMGEGATAFGWGHYFAESPGVAKSYQKDLTDYRLELDGIPLNRDTAPDDLVEVVDSVFSNPRKEGIKGWKKFVEGEESFARRALDSEDAGIAQMARDILAENKKRRAVMQKYEGRLKDSTGHLYEVDIPDEVTAKMLDWDKPLSEQPKNVQRAIKEMFGDDLRIDEKGQWWIEGGAISNGGQGFYADLTGRFLENGRPGNTVEAQKKASEFLNEAGIPGIRFLDRQSRGKGEGTRNIVLFDENLITKVKRDGEEVYNAKKFDDRLRSTLKLDK